MLNALNQYLGLFMKIEEVGVYVNNIAKYGLTYDCVFTFFQPLYEAIINNEEIARKFAAISNTHTELLHLFQKDEDSLELITTCIERWSSCIAILSKSQLSAIRIMTVRKSQVIALQLVNDSDPDVRFVCALLWSSCAKKLINDTHPKIQQASKNKLEKENTTLQEAPHV